MSNLKMSDNEGDGFVCIGWDIGYSHSFTVHYSVWIDDNYEQIRHAMQDGSQAKFRVILYQMLQAKDLLESEAFLRVGVNWSGIVITDAPSPGLVSRGGEQ